MWLDRNTKPAGAPLLRLAAPGFLQPLQPRAISMVSACEQLTVRDGAPSTSTLPPGRRSRLAPDKVYL